VPNFRTLAPVIALPLGFAVAGASAEDLTKEELASRLNGIAVEDISDAPIPGLYEVAVGANVAYVTKDGRFIIRGDIYDAETSANVSEETRARARATMLGSVDPASLIVFKPASGEVKHTVTIFTDIDCGYCRQFHREIDKVTALGIEVHYLFYPRTGPDTESWTKADQVWCAGNRNTALTRAKLGGEIPDSDSCATPVADHYELGQRIGVRGTPAVFSEAGELLGGYLPPATLAKVLDDPNAAIE
jgi:thiol:disulfide interchange protein DsbC